VAVAVHVVSWIAQFVGHGKYEGRKPALLDNLVQALFLAPLFQPTAPTRSRSGRCSRSREAKSDGEGKRCEVGTELIRRNGRPECDRHTIMGTLHGPLSWSKIL
jgi:stalled ribosome alternative rescue factor ArfA